jgi:L-tyrosine isonitrile synthase
MSSGVACGGSAAARSLTQEYGTKTAVTTLGRTVFRGDGTVVSAGDAFAAHQARDQELRASAAKIVRAFNTWAFKREQPSDAPLMLRTVANSVAAWEPIRFVLYWGKGPRHRAGAPETECLDFLAGLTARIAANYAPGAALTLILTDTHAELNGQRREDIQRYFDDITTAAAQRGFATCWLGQLVKAAGAAATAVPFDEPVAAEMLRSLVASARKWYRGSATAQEGALAYLRMNLIEQGVVERTFPGTIFITFNGGELRGLFPRHLPIFYMYSLRRGVSVKPWFFTAESTQREAKADGANSVNPRTA